MSTGIDAAGYFAAAWGIIMTYVGFLPGAMGADDYPRLTEVIHDRDAASWLMNDQAQLGLVIICRGNWHCQFAHRVGENWFRRATSRKMLSIVCQVRLAYQE